MRTRTFGLSADISSAEADELVPIISEQMSRLILNDVRIGGMIPLSEPSVRVEDVSWVDDETGEHYEFKRVICRCEGGAK